MNKGYYIVSYKININSARPEPYDFKIERGPFNKSQADKINVLSGKLSKYVDDSDRIGIIAYSDGDKLYHVHWKTTNPLFKDGPIREGKKKMKKKNTVEIKEDVRIPNTDMILEKGDKIEIIKENVGPYINIIEDLVDFGKTSDTGEVLSVFISAWAEMEKLGYTGGFESSRDSLIQALSGFQGEQYMGSEYWVDKK